MDNFEAKVNAVVSNLKNEGQIASTDVKNSQGLIDPMLFESDEAAMDFKKQAWMDIFQQYPEMSNKLIAIFKDKEMDRIQQWLNVYCDHHDFGELILGLLDCYGDEVYDNLLVLHNDGKVSMGWYEPPKDETEE